MNGAYRYRAGNEEQTVSGTTGLLARKGESVTGKREERLRELLFPDAVAVTPKPVLSSLLTPRSWDYVDHLLHLLDAHDKSEALTPDVWDMVLLSDSTYIELDEENHFTRYRKRTLDPEWSRALPWRDPYREFADKFEHRARTDGRFWKPRRRVDGGPQKAERIFGRAGDRGNFEGNGSPRWKVRALYDAAKDLCAIDGSVRLARLSIYDTIDGVPLGELLLRSTPVDVSALRDLLEERTIGADACPLHS